MFSISAVSCFDDNYIWVLQQGSQVIAVDPGQAAPLQAFLNAHSLTLHAVLLTHRHADHVGGVAELCAAQPDLAVYGPAGLAEARIAVSEGDQLTLLGHDFQVIATPGHTREHLSYLCEDALFCGDTLFGGGCGRVFDGEPAQLFASLSRLAALPAHTRVFCTHEYTLSNLRFSAAVEPYNPFIQQRIRDTETLRAQEKNSLPSTIGIECASNPFLRCTEAAVIACAQTHGARTAQPCDVFIALREWKNHYK